MFTQSFVQAQIKENIKAPRHWPLRGNSPMTGEFPAQRASNAEMFPFDDAMASIMTSPECLHGGLLLGAIGDLAHWTVGDAGKDLELIIFKIISRIDILSIST